MLEATRRRTARWPASSKARWRRSIARRSCSSSPVRDRSTSAWAGSCTTRSPSSARRSIDARRSSTAIWIGRCLSVLYRDARRRTRRSTRRPTRSLRSSRSSTRSRSCGARGASSRPPFWGTASANTWRRASPGVLEPRRRAHAGRRARPTHSGAACGRRDGGRLRGRGAGSSSCSPAPGRVSIAAVNAPDNVVISGDRRGGSGCRRAAARPTASESEATRRVARVPLAPDGADARRVREDGRRR